MFEYYVLWKNNSFLKQPLGYAGGCAFWVVPRVAPRVVPRGCAGGCALGLCRRGSAPGYANGLCRGVVRGVVAGGEVPTFVFVGWLAALHWRVVLWVALESCRTACCLHWWVAEGHHKATCVFDPPNLKSQLAQMAVQRESLAGQLAKASMTLAQRTAALDMMFGPVAGAASSSSASGSEF